MRCHSPHFGSGHESTSSAAGFTSSMAPSPASMAASVLLHPAGYHHQGLATPVQAPMLSLLTPFSVAAVAMIDY
jgi:hypothetical protein